MDEADQELRGNKDAVVAEKRLYKGSASDNFHMRAESGTCDVCAAPCSSCMHTNSTLSVMESKIEDECSNEVCGEKESSLCQSKGCDDRQATASETSNLMSASSSHGSFSENAESNATVKIFDTFEDAEGIPPLSKGGGLGEDQRGRSCGVSFQGGVHVSPCKHTPSVLGQRSMSRKYDQKGLDCHGDNLSCVTGVRDSITSSRKEDSGISSGTPYSCVKSGPIEMLPSKFKIGDSKELVESQRELSESSKLHGQETGSGSVQKFALPSIGDNKSSLARSTSSAGALMKIHPCLETESGDSENVPSKARESLGIHIQTKDSVSLYGETKTQKLSSQLGSDSEPSGSDILEDDVKVCDICGDTGREDLLAICSRCSDGAEHTYCMQIMLDKVPEGDWLCEGCKLKEDAENEKTAKHENDDVSGKNELATYSKLPSLSGQSQHNGPTFNQKDRLQPKLSKLPKLDMKPQEAEGGRLKSVMSPLSAKRQADSMEVSSKPKRQAIETIVASNCKRTSLTRECSFKSLDAGKSKPVQIQPANNNHLQESFQSLAASSPSSSRIGTRLLSPKGSLSMSNAFSSINSKPKVKQVVDDLGQKQKLDKELGIIDAKKEGLNRILNKSSSLKITSMGRSNANDLKAKMQTSNASRAEPARGLKFAKEKQPLEGRTTLKPERPMVNSAPTTPSNQSFPKLDSAIAGVNKAFEPAISGGGGEEKKLPTSNGLCNSEEQKPYHFGQREDAKPKEISSLSGSQSAISTGIRVVRCFKCNEAGHSAQFCTSSNLRASALKAPTARKSREGVQKSSKWKDVVQAAMSKNARHKTTNKLPDKFDEQSMSSTDLSSEAATSKDQLCSSSSCLRNFSYLESAQPSKEVDQMPSISSECMSWTTRMSSQTSELGQQLRISATIPEHDYIWQGSFEVQRSGGRCPEFFNGLQAHLSSFASPKVPEAVNKFPPKVQVVEVPRLNSWPIQFQRRGACEDNIALYFFAKDLGSYERCYKKLVENMIKNDLALKANFNGIDLLVFPSNQLPEKAHRWNRLFYLWGVFRERKENGAEPLPSSQKHVCLDGLGVDHTVGERGTSRNDTSREKIQELENGVDNGHNTEMDVQRDPIKNVEYSLEFRISRKRPRSNCLETMSEAPVETSRASQSKTWKEKADCTQEYDGEKDHKQKSYSVLPFKDSSHVDRISCRTNSDSSFLKVEQEGDHLCGVTLFPGTLRATERSFFPVDFGPVKDNKLESTSWNMVSLKDDPAEPDLPNLELALGGEKKSCKKEVLPLFLQLIEEKSTNKKTERLIDDGVDEASAALSLSLAFPGPEKKPTTVKPASKTEQLLPESRHVNTSLLLFGGFTDT
ncbi:ASI1-immunoprecipitated protein 2-like isoform X2 [Aristolochia californica]